MSTIKQSDSKGSIQNRSIMYETKQPLYTSVSVTTNEDTKIFKKRRHKNRSILPVVKPKLAAEEDAEVLHFRSSRKSSKQPASCIEEEQVSRINLRCSERIDVSTKDIKTYSHFYTIGGDDEEPDFVYRNPVSRT